MLKRFRKWLVAAALAGCSSHPHGVGRIVVVLTIDWEGATMSSEALDAIDATRKSTGGAPITHFVSAAYFTKAAPDPTATDTLSAALHPGDELAVHLHAWRSLAEVSGVKPRLAPSFLTGTDKLLVFDDGDEGFDVDLDAYSLVDLRAMVRQSRRLLEATHLPVSKSFRAGGYLATPKVLEAIRDEGFTVDSSATDYRRINIGKEEFLGKRLQKVWPTINEGSQPYTIHEAPGELLEMPIAAIADYSTATQIVSTFEAAHARLRAAPGRDVFVVLAFHEETAVDFADRLAQAIANVSARPEFADELTYTTIQHAAERVRH